MKFIQSNKMLRSCVRNLIEINCIVFTKSNIKRKNPGFLFRLSSNCKLQDSSAWKNKSLSSYWAFSFVEVDKIPAPQTGVNYYLTQLRFLEDRKPAPQLALWYFGNRRSVRVKITKDCREVTYITALLIMYFLFNIKSNDTWVGQCLSLPP